MSDCGNTCGLGGWGGPKPGDPSNNSILSATPAFGGIDVTWTYPTTNPHAVAYVKLYRSNSSNFNNAILLAEASGGFYYDKLSDANPRYYWIRFISVNGTEGELIGPASASARPAIQEVIEQLTGKIDSGLLAESLKQEIGKITLNYNELQQEIQDRLAGHDILSIAIAQADDKAQQTLAFIAEEMTTRANGDNALASQINTVAALNETNAAAILEEKTARVTADEALALDISQVAVASQTAAAAVNEIKSSRIGYAALASDQTTPYDGDGVTVVYPAANYPSSTYPDYAIKRTRIIDQTGVVNWNATPAGIAKPLIWVRGMPIATAVKQVGVTGPNGGYASLEQAMMTQQSLNGSFKAMYTARLSVNGLIGGFGIYNDGAIVEAGFDVDRFWIGRTNSNKRKPFIIENDEVFIDQAAINKLTFSKLRDEGGAFIVENGKVKADYISGRGLTITDNLGNILLNAGTAQFMGNVTGAVNGTPVSTLTTNLNKALSDSATAKSTADAAASGASVALTKLADIADDDVLTQGEKPAVVAEYSAITGEQPGISAQAATFSVSATAYTSAFNALASYLASLTTPTAWNNYSGNTNVVRATFNSKFTDYYTARQNLLNAIATATKVLADNAQAAANQANSGLTNRIRSDARNVFSGAGGIAVGNLTWNSTGDYTGGSGLGMTQKGLAAFNAQGVPTFVIDGTTGDATFGGQLTANAVNAVKTINIAGNAVVVPSAASGSYQALCVIVIDGLAPGEYIPATVLSTIVQGAGRDNFLWQIRYSQTNNPATAQVLVSESPDEATTGALGTTKNIQNGTHYFWTYTPQQTGDARCNMVVLATKR